MVAASRLKPFAPIPSAASKPFPATSAFSSAPSPISSPTAPAFARPPRTPFSTPTTSGTISRRLRTSLFPALHARSRFQRRLTEEKRRQHHGHRQAPYRLRLPSLHNRVSPHRPRRAHD